MVPYKDLPLQATLQFQPCTTGLASSFLQALCLAEGVKVEREALERAYINSHLRDPPYLPDLRHTIIQLQFWSTGGKKSDVVTGGPNASSFSPTGPGLMLAVEDSSNAASTNVEKGIPGILRQLAKKSDFLSGLDSELSRDANGTLRVRQSTIYTTSCSHGIVFARTYPHMNSSLHQTSSWATLFFLQIPIQTISRFQPTITRMKT